jgi:phosphatidylinositol alpha-mannosyltransferase
MKIALVSPYDFAYPGGVVNHILALNNQFTKMGHDVRIIAPASREVKNAGCQFVAIGKARPIPVRGTTIRIAISLRLASKIKEVLAKEKFDIIHLHEPFMPMLCSAVLRFSDTVNVGTFHAARGGKPGYYWGWPISAYMLHRRRQKLVGRIAVSKPAKDFASRYVPGEYDIIPNGIDLGHFSSSVLPIDEFCDGKLNILFVGRLEKRKGFDYLLKAYRRVKQEFPKSRMIVVGPGTRFRRKYEKQVRKNNIADVVFVGNVPYDELPRYYKTADIYCSPAIGQESFGIVLLEAMAVGKPVVATNIEGYAGVMTDGREGLLVPPKNERKLAEALTRLMSDDSMRRQMGGRGLITAQQYDWEKVARRVYDYYIKILRELPYREGSLEYEPISAPVQRKQCL